MHIYKTKLNRIAVEHGDVLKILSAKEDSYQGFGEVYISEVMPGRIKAWKKHSLMTLNLIVPKGAVKFVFTRDGLEFAEYTIGEENYARLTVGPRIWFGFKNIGSELAYVVNVADIVHEPKEVEKSNLDRFEYNWNNL